MIRIKNYKYPVAIRLIFILAFSLSLTALVLYFQPTSLYLVAKMSVKSKFLMPLLNLLPILFLTLLLYYITTNMYIATSIPYIIFVVMSLVNRYKIIYRNDPLTPKDLALGKEAFTITGNTGGYEIEYKLFIFAAIVFIVMNIVIYLMNLPKPNTKKYRVIVPAVVIVLSSILFPKVYADKVIWNKLPNTGSYYNLSANYNHKGVVYSFIHFINLSEIQKPEGYDKNRVENYIKDHPATEKKEKKMPHIVMIMGEAFSDISNYGFFEFNLPEDDPLYHFNKLCEESILSGHIVVSSFGGGTANTEYDVLTGNVTTLLNENNVSPFGTIRKPFHSLVNILNDHNYNTLGIHPGKRWFYNRGNVYDYFGFKHTLFEKDFENPTYYAAFMSEEDTTNRLMEEFKKADKSVPLFEYCVTIQNHGGYPNWKYGGREINKNFKTTSPLKTEDFDMFSVFFEGIRDMDHQINVLTEHFKAIDEPVIFIYYGDHLPFLGYNNRGFNLINYDVSGNTLDSARRLYSTPYVIWANNQAKELLDKEFIDSLKSFDKETINASYLGAILLGMLDLEKEDVFFNFINELKHKMPIIQRDFLCLKQDDNFTLKYPNEVNDESYDLYKYFIYYNNTK